MTRKIDKIANSEIVVTEAMIEAAYSVFPYHYQNASDMHSTVALDQQMFTDILGMLSPLMKGL